MHLNWGGGGAGQLRAGLIATGATLAAYALMAGLVCGSCTAVAIFAVLPA
jgi:hypothetical protein